MQYCHPFAYSLCQSAHVWLAELMHMSAQLDWLGITWVVCPAHHANANMQTTLEEHAHHITVTYQS